MAKTLNEFKKEFEAIKQLTVTSTKTLQTIDHNRGTHKEFLKEHFAALGVRIHELRDAGTPGTTLAAFMGDPSVAHMVKELTNRREALKKLAVELGHLRTTAVLPIKARTKVLETNLAAEIATRQKAVSSKLLGLNQSVKEMDPLLVQLKAFKQTPEFKYINTQTAPHTPADDDKLYNDLLDEELAKGKDEAVKAAQLGMRKQKLADRNIKHVIVTARTAFKELALQAKLGRAAHKAKDVPALAAAKKAGAQAVDKLNAVVEPIQALMKDPDVLAAVHQSPDRALVEKNTQTLFDLHTEAESLLEELESRRMA